MAVLLWWGSCRQLQAPSTANVGGDLRCSYARPDYMPQTWQAILRCVLGWSRGVTVSTLDSESSDRGSNPRETCELSLDLIACPCATGRLLFMAVLLWLALAVSCKPPIIARAGGDLRRSYT